MSRSTIHRERRSRSTGPRRGSAFTIVELLVVVSILMLLVALMLPALRMGREAAVRASCGARVREIFNASLAYSNDNSGWFPYRKPGAYMPHRVYISGQFDLTTSFVDGYVVDRLPNMFCPGRLFQARNPDVYSAYVYDYVSYQYCNFDGTDAAWHVAKPDLRRNTAVGSYTLWACITTLKPEGNYLAHDIAEEKLTPTGLNAARIDGSAGWSDWQNCENYVRSNSHEWWWAKP